MTIPIWLTVSRLLFIPLFVVFYYLPSHAAHYTAAAIFIAAAVTDWLDGYLARTLKQVSKLGAFLDPVADKLMVAVALVLIVSDPGLHYIAIPAAIIVGREIVISALREWMAELGKRASIAVSFVSKVKTAIQMVAISAFLVYQPNGSSFLLAIGYITLYASAILTLWTMWMYLKAAWPELLQSAIPQAGDQIDD